MARDKSFLPPQKHERWGHRYFCTKHGRFGVDQGYLLVVTLPGKKRTIFFLRRFQAKAKIFQGQLGKDSGERLTVRIPFTTTGEKNSFCWSGQNQGLSKEGIPRENFGSPHEMMTTVEVASDS